MQNTSASHTTRYVRLAQCRLPVRKDVVFQLMMWGEPSGTDRLLVLERRIEGADAIPLVRIQSPCLTGEVLGSLRCECRPQLDMAIEMIIEQPRGIVVYPLSHEGRGIGLLNKIRAYDMQDQGLDTFEANQALGFDNDERQYDGVVEVLRRLGVSSMVLLTENPLKARALRDAGFDVVETRPLNAPANPYSDSYMKVKREWFSQGGENRYRPNLRRST